MSFNQYISEQKAVEELWHKITSKDTTPYVPQPQDFALVSKVLHLLNRGEVRVADRDTEGFWHVHSWLKQAILLSFRLNPNEIISGGPSFSDAQDSFWYDKVPPKFKGWTSSDFKLESLRIVPPAYVRFSAYLGKNVVVMPSFINVGAYVGEGTMVDTWATIGSCAQIGKYVHISGGAGIGGVLEPLQANPVIIEDHCFIGARSEIAEGVIIRQGSVIAMGCFISASTKIIHRATGEIHYGEIPAYSVVVPGSYSSGQKTSSGNEAPHLACCVIIKQVDEKTRSKTGINELLRDEG